MVAGWWQREKISNDELGHHRAHKVNVVGMGTTYQRKQLIPVAGAFKSAEQVRFKWRRDDSRSLCLV